MVPFSDASAISLEVILILAYSSSSRLEFLPVTLITANSSLSSGAPGLNFFKSSFVPFASLTVLLTSRIFKTLVVLVSPSNRKISVALPPLFPTNTMS